jgi:hypothetical protein
VIQDRVIEYLRSRGQATPPLDLVDGVMRAIGGLSAQQGRRFTPALAIGGAIAGAAVIAAVVILGWPSALFVTQPSPKPTSSTSPTASTPLADSASPMPIPTAEPVSYVAKEGLPFTVIDSAEADALFEVTQRCTSAAGYEITYPASWYTNHAVYTNPAIEETPACSWFGPRPFEGANLGIHPGAAVSVGISEAFDDPWGGHPAEEVTIAGLTGRRIDFPGSRDHHSYFYDAWAPEDVQLPGGEHIHSGTRSDRIGDYTLNRAVLDRMMASLILIEDESPTTFAPGHNAEAQALFADPRSCTSSGGGWAIQFPVAWYTDETGDQDASEPDAACTLFGPDPIVEGVNAAISSARIEGDYGSFEQPVARQHEIVAGRPAVRVEYRGAAGEGGTQPQTWRQLVWLIQIGGTEESGPNLVFTTSTDDPGDYELNKAILDRMIASLELVEPTTP